MSNITEDVQVDLVLPQLSAINSKALLQKMIREVSPKIGFPAIMLFDRLISRETIAGSGIGSGVAIPHLKLKGMSGPFAALATLKNPIDFDAPDNKPVNLVYLQLSPLRDGPLHLRRLSRISRLLRNKELQQKITETTDAEAIRGLLTAPEEWMMAA